MDKFEFKVPEGHVCAEDSVNCFQPSARLVGRAGIQALECLVCGQQSFYTVKSTFSPAGGKAWAFDLVQDEMEIAKIKENWVN